MAKRLCAFVAHENGNIVEITVQHNLDGLTDGHTNTKLSSLIGGLTLAFSINYWLADIVY